MNACLCIGSDTFVRSTSVWFLGGAPRLFCDAKQAQSGIAAAGRSEGWLLTHGVVLKARTRLPCGNVPLRPALKNSHSIVGNNIQAFFLSFLLSSSLLSFMCLCWHADYSVTLGSVFLLCFGWKTLPNEPLWMPWFWMHRAEKKWACSMITTWSEELGNSLFTPFKLHQLNCTINKSSGQAAEASRVRYTPQYKSDGWRKVSCSLPKEIDPEWED